MNRKHCNNTLIKLSHDIVEIWEESERILYF